MFCSQEVKGLDGEEMARWVVFIAGGGEALAAINVDVCPIDGRLQ
jgi:hypothetical protein